ncbi:unnamed protein product [Lupinus luteus]|uniref:Glycosyltransferase n=1 Tax=Lupinus luteus TaxID=3873 RepID=A0AAV1WMN6_LUPLU
MESKNLCQPHFIFIPLMAPGHILPMVDMAKLLSRRNVKVTIVTTPLNSIPFQDTIDREIQNGSPIQIQLFQFPNDEAGIPKGCESVDTLPSRDLMPNFPIALDMLHKPLEELCEKLEPFPSCIICDKHIPCVAEIANKLKVPRIIFDGTSCFHLLCAHNLHASKVHEGVSSEEKFIIPGLPHRIELQKSQLPGLFNPNSNQNVNAFREKIRACEENSYGIVVNSFEELELEYVKEFQRVTGRRVWCVGPVSLSNKGILDKAQRGKRENNTNDENHYMKWLDSWPISSVIYVCLGSLSNATPEQLIEIGLGLEATKRPFIWVIRGAYKRDEIETWLVEYGFEDRVKGRGLLIKGWAPQVLILSHKSIGTFLTHCGWNSTLEGICAGVPLVTYPLFAEQFFNEKVVVQVLESGVSLGAENGVHLGEEEKSRVQVKRENVRDAIEKVMGEGEEQERIREVARKWAHMAKKAIEEGGSSYNNMSQLIEDIIHIE